MLAPTSTKMSAPAPTVADIQEQITENNAAIVEADCACQDLEDAWENAEREDQRALAADPDAPADAQAQVEAQLRRQRSRRAGLQERAESLARQLDAAKAAEFRAQIPRLLKQRKRLNNLAQAAMDTLVERLEEHISIGRELREIHQQVAFAESGGVRGPVDRAKYDSETLLSTWILGSVARMTGLRVNTSHGVPSNYAPLPDMDEAVQ